MTAVMPNASVTELHPLESLAVTVRWLQQIFLPQCPLPRS